MTTLAPSYYAHYIEAGQSHWWFRGRARILATIVRRFVQLPEVCVILDVGSGPGGPARGLFPQGRIIAVDLSDLALRTYEKADSRVVADATRVPFRPQSVTALCAFDVLEHLDDDAEALRNWTEILAPGGWLVMTVPAYAELWSRHDEINGHRRRYRAHELSRLLMAAGLTVERLTYFNSLLLPGVAAVRWGQRLFKKGYVPDTNTQHDESDFGLHLPGWLEHCCEWALHLEALWLRRFTLPAGVSICVVARARGPKPAS